MISRFLIWIRRLSNWCDLMLQLGKWSNWVLWVSYAASPECPVNSLKSCISPAGFLSLPIEWNTLLWHNQCIYLTFVLYFIFQFILVRGRIILLKNDLILDRVYLNFKMKSLLRTDKIDCSFHLSIIVFQVNINLL